VSKETWTIIQDLKEWYVLADEIDWPTFANWFKFVRHASMKVEQLEIYAAVFREVELFVPTASDQATIDALIQRAYAAEISEAASDIADGDSGSLDAVDKLMADWKAETDRVSAIESMKVSMDMDDIMAVVMPTGGMKWRLPELNLSLGPLRKGSFITFGARPDSGKTTLLASEVSFMAEQMASEGKRVVWFSNEEAGERVIYRVLQACLGITNTQFSADPDWALEEYTSRMGGNKHIITVYHNNFMHVDYVVEECEKYRDEIGLIVFDQLRKFHGVGSSKSNEVAVQAKLFAWARGIASYAPLLNVHQAKGEAAGVMYPEMDMLYGSTTEIQGECDAVVMLGKTNDPEYGECARGLYSPKNKLFGDLSTEGKFRNAKFEVEIQREIARFKGAY
jgi:replicative DNA helicase